MKTAKILFPVLLVMGAGLVLRFADPFPDAADQRSEIVDLRVLTEDGKSVFSASSSRVGTAKPEPVPEMPVALEGPPSRPLRVLDQVPAGEQASFQAALHEAQYAAWPLEEVMAQQPRNAGVSHFASNPAQDITARFLTAGGVRFGSGQSGKSWQGILRFAARNTGPDETGEPERTGSPGHFPWKAGGTRTETEHGELTEWYENGRDGFEHGFTLRERPAMAAAGPVTLRMTLTGLRAERDPAPSRKADLVFTDPDTNEAVLSYRGLKVWDADGRQLAADLCPEEGGFLIAINDGEARYPVTVDPLIASLEQHLTAGDAAGDPVAIAMEDDYLVVATLAGSYGFTRLNGEWRRQVTLGFPGRSVALSRGLTVIGDPWNETVAVFQNNTFIQNLTSVPGYGSSGGNFGAVVDALQDSRIVVGAPPSIISNPVYHGRAYVFKYAPGVQPEGPWVPMAIVSQGVSGGSGNALGSSVATDGPDYLIVGSPSKENSSGLGVSGKVFTYRLIDNPDASASLYGNAQLQSTYAATEVSPGDQFGKSVSGTFYEPVIGAPGWSSPNGAPGAGAVFSGNTRLPAINGTIAGDGWGVSVRRDLSGRILAASRTGKAAVYSPSTGVWSLLADIPAGPKIGVAVAASGGTMAVACTSTVPGEGGSISIYTGRGSSWPLQKTLTFGAGAEDNFGLHLDLDGEAAVIGALNDDTPSGANAGSAYVFRRTGTVWQREARLLDPDGAAQDRFGVSVGISGETVVTGADFDDATNGQTVWADAGSVSIFQKTGSGAWARQVKIHPSLEAGANSGRSVAIDGEIIAAGAPYANTEILIPRETISRTGRVSIFARENGAWLHRAVIFSPSPQAGGIFGFSVAVQGTRLLVGEPLRDQGVAADAGRAVAFVRQSEGIGQVWAQEKEFRTQVAARGERFGFSVALDSSSALIGASCGPAGWTSGGLDHSTGSGKAWVSTFNAGVWTSLQEIISPSPGNNHFFGFAVSVDGDQALVSAPGWGGSRGAAYLFRKTGSTWTFQYQLPVSPMTDNDWFGVAVALSGDTALAGGYGFDTAASNAGAARVFRIVDPAADPSPLRFATPPGGGGIFTLTWPAGSGLALWQTPNSLSGPWTRVPDSENRNTHSFSPGADPRLFFRLAPP